MDTTIITARSNKEAIIQAAEECISDREDKLSAQQKLSTELREERNTVIGLLAATSIYGLLF